MQQLEKEYETLKENDPAELQKAISLTQVGVGKLLLVSLTPPKLDWADSDPLHGNLGRPSTCNRGCRT